MNTAELTYTFLHTIDCEKYPAAIKFESPRHNRSEFTVTVLNDPQITPFKMQYDEGTWLIENTTCHKVYSLKDELIRIASKFKR